MTKYYYAYLIMNSVCSNVLSEENQYIGRNNKQYICHSCHGKKLLLQNIVFTCSHRIMSRKGLFILQAKSMIPLMMLLFKICQIVNLAITINNKDTIKIFLLHVITTCVKRNLKCLFKLLLMTLNFLPFYLNYRV